jgi:4,4'-diaponeurosporenoate glycosyltransferase
VFTLVLGIIGVCGFALLSLRHPKLRILEKAHPHAPRISIVIPARNEEKNLLHLLESITHQTLQPYEVIVVDDASTDRTREVAESFGVFVADTQRFDAMPKPVALHSGYLQTRGDVIVFLDADVVLDPAFVSSLSHHFARHSSGCITLQPTHNCSSIVDQLSHFFHISSITGSGLLSAWPFTIGLFGPCIALTRDVYESTGGFGNLDVASSVIEDVELAHVLTSMNVTTHRYMGTGLISYRMYTSLVCGDLGVEKKHCARCPNFVARRGCGSDCILWIFTRRSSRNHSIVFP